MIRSRCIAIVTALLLPLGAMAQGAQPDSHPAPSAPASPPAGEQVTRHTLGLPGRSLEFTAHVGTMRLANPQGVAQAEVVTTAFVLAGAAPGTRPVMFAVNGGPGSASAWLNLGAIGPWRVPLDGPAILPSMRPGVVDNAETWLDFTDLVFLDPPGTGYSRIVAQGDEVPRQIWSVDGDIQLLSAVARRWLEAHGRLGSPKFIVGESYGGFRGPKLARALLERQGVGVSGLVLVSPVLDFNGRDAPWDPLRWVGRLPSLAAAARGASSRTDLRDVEEYASGEYLTDLVRGERDRPATERMAARVAALTGMDAGLVLRRAGRVNDDAFLRDREPGRVGSPYDATIGAADPFPAAANDNSPDAVLDGLRGPLTSAMLEVYASKLNWKPEGAPERQYELLNMQVGRAWDYGRRNARPESFTDLRQYVSLDPAARVLVTHGLTDLVTPYYATKLLLDQMPDTVPAGRVTLRAYGGGHMFYTRDLSRATLHADAAALVQAALAEPSNTAGH